MSAEHNTKAGRDLELERLRKVLTRLKDQAQSAYVRNDLYALGKLRASLRQVVREEENRVDEYDYAQPK